MRTQHSVVCTIERQEAAAATAACLYECDACDDSVYSQNQFSPFGTRERKKKKTVRGKERAPGIVVFADSACGHSV